MQPCREIYAAFRAGPGLGRMAPHTQCHAGGCVRGGRGGAGRVRPAGAVLAVRLGTGDGTGDRRAGKPRACRRAGPIRHAGFGACEEDRPM